MLRRNTSYKKSLKSLDIYHEFETHYLSCLLTKKIIALVCGKRRTKLKWNDLCLPQPRTNLLLKIEQIPNLSNKKVAKMVWNDFAGKHYSILYYTVKIAFRPYAMHHHCMLELWRASTLYFAANSLPFPLPHKKISIWTGLLEQVHLFLANAEELDCKKLSFKVFDPAV